MHRRMAEMVVRNMPLTMQEVPFDIPPIREALQWNITNNNDKTLRWVVDRLAAAALLDNGPGDADVRDSSELQSLEIEYRMNYPQG